MLAHWGLSSLADHWNSENAIWRNLGESVWRGDPHSKACCRGHPSQLRTPPWTSLSTTGPMTETILRLPVSVTTDSLINCRDQVSQLSPGLPSKSTELWEIIYAYCLKSLCLVCYIIKANWYRISLSKRLK